MNLLNIDFNKLYIEQKTSSSFKPKTKEEWNSKADDMNSVVKNDPYIDTLVQMIESDGCDTLLDVGCGAGTVCMNLRDRFTKAVAIDYSPSMIERLHQNIESNMVTNIEPKLLSWEDSWSDLGEFDMVIASRSMQVLDMREALVKLNSVAKKRVYLTTKVGGSFLPKDIYTLLDRDIVPNPDYIYILNILYSLGIDAELKYIELRDDRLSLKNEDRFLSSISWSIGRLSNTEIDRLREFYHQEGSQKEYTIKWAVISWKK